jgi:hypothetical protein
MGTRTMITTDPTLAAIAMALGSQVTGISDDGRKVTFALAGVPEDFEQDLSNDALQVSARKVLDHTGFLVKQIRARKGAR